MATFDPITYHQQVTITVARTFRPVALGLISLFIGRHHRHHEPSPYPPNHTLQYPLSTLHLWVTTRQVCPPSQWIPIFLTPHLTRLVIEDGTRYKEPDHAPWGQQGSAARLLSAGGRRKDNVLLSPPLHIRTIEVYRRQSNKTPRRENDGRVSDNSERISTALSLLVLTPIAHPRQFFKDPAKWGRAHVVGNSFGCATSRLYKLYYTCRSW